ncbi:MAG: hypothetical protein ACJ73S_10015 [Mycobacteriales bacterium]|jgi:hypothetical protein
MPEIHLPRDHPPEDRPEAGLDSRAAPERRDRDPLAWFDRYVELELGPEAAQRVREAVEQAESRTPRADALRERRPEGFPAPAWDKVCDGVGFDEIRAPHYAERGGGNEIVLENGKRLDSYIPAEAIVSRKHTQLAEVQIETAIGYLRELDRKYSANETLADTPRNRAQLPGEIGKNLDGFSILEVPPQRADVPGAVLEEADRLGIVIRDSDGREHRLP